MESILIVEDKESMAEMLKETIEAAGYRPVIARDGSEGIRKLKDDKIGGDPEGNPRSGRLSRRRKTSICLMTI